MPKLDIDRIAAPATSLTIAEVETIPIRVPLGRTYRGSRYKMTHRSTIVVRVHTVEGIVVFQAK